MLWDKNWGILPGPNTGFEFGRRYECIKSMDHKKRRNILLTHRFSVLFYVKFGQTYFDFKKWTLFLATTFFEWVRTLEWELCHFWLKFSFSTVFENGCQTSHAQKAKITETLWILTVIYLHVLEKKFVIGILLIKIFPF